MFNTFLTRDRLHPAVTVCMSLACNLAEKKSYSDEDFIAMVDNSFSIELFQEMKSAIISKLYAISAVDVC